MRKDIAVFGLYPTRTELEGAVEALRSAGFRGTDISILMPQDRATHELGHEVNSKAPEGGVTGAAAGGAVGGVLAWLASVGMLTVPGIGPLRRQQVGGSRQGNSQEHRRTGNFIDRRSDRRLPSVSV